MAVPKPRIIDGMKFMWDGIDYESIDVAKKALAEYEKENFESRIIEEGDTIEVYTRRVVTDVQVEGPPPM